MTEWETAYQATRRFEKKPEEYAPEERIKRAQWIRDRDAGAGDEFFTIEAIRYLQDKYAAQMPARELDEEGHETLASLSRRGKTAVALGLDEFPGGWMASPYTYKALRKFLLPQDKRDAMAAGERASLEELYAKAPDALAKMGLREREIAVLGDIQETRETLMVKRWLVEGKRWAFILSGVGGAGKSVALAAALHQHCRERIDTQSSRRWRWRPSLGHYVLAGELTSGVAFGSEGEERIRRFSQYPLLCIDDLGTETLTDVGRDMLFRILDTRYRDARKCLTLIATNLSWPELVQRYGERFNRRLNKDSEQGGAFLRLQDKFQAGPRLGPENA